MPTLEQIQEQIKKLDSLSKFFGRKEIKELPNILWHDEQLTGLIQGMYKNGTGLLVATNHRLVFVNKKLLGGIVVEDFPYDKISTIQYDTGLLLGKITIFTSGNKAVIEQTDKKQTRVFCDEVRARINKKDSVPVMQQPGTANVADELTKLAELKAKGIITEEEFQQQKAKLLA